MPQRQRSSEAVWVAWRGLLLMLATAFALVLFLGVIIMVGMRRVAAEQASAPFPHDEKLAHATQPETLPATRPADAPPPVVARATEALRAPARAAGVNERNDSPELAPVAPVVPKATASLLAVDDTSQGGWVGRYGMQGYYVAMSGQTPHVPPGVDLALTPSQLYTWGPFTTDPRGLSIPATPAQFSAGQWWSWDRLLVDLDLRESGKSYQVGLYLLDWDSDARAQRLEVIDVLSGAVLLSRTDEHFHKGRYLILRLSGHVMLRITHTGGANGTLSAIFFDHPATIAPADAPREQGASNGLGRERR